MWNADSHMMKHLGKELEHHPDAREHNAKLIQMDAKLEQGALSGSICECEAPLNIDSGKKALQEFAKKLS